MTTSNALLMNQARASHARGDLAQAARLYEHILRLDPRDYEAAYLLAVALYQAGRLEPAAAAFAVAVSISPRKVEAHKDRGLVLAKLGRHAEALTCFETATRLMPGSPELLLNRGLAQKNTGRLAEAAQSYEEALRLKPDFAEAHNNLANALSALGRKEEALAHYRQAFTLKPQYGEAYVNAARLLVEGERLEEAMAILDQAIAANPRHAEAHRSRAECLNLMGRMEEALADYSAALALEPRNMEALLDKAQLLSRLSRHDEAVALCHIAIATDPADARGYYRIGRALEGRREFGAAIASYERAAALDPDWLQPLLRRAGALNELGRQQEALDAYDAALAHHPDASEAHLGKGDALRAQRRFEEALACYDAAIALAPEKAFHRGTRGSLKSEMGQVEQALEDFGAQLKLIATGKPMAEAMVEDCIRLLSVDKIPAIYATEEDLARTRARIEAELDALVQRYPSPIPLEAGQRKVSEQAVRHLTGFYLAYHQCNDRETMRKLSRVATNLLALPPHKVAEHLPHGGRIRVGIASQRLRNHNGANWAYNWFANLPLQDYEIFTYSFERSTDALGRKFASLGTHRELSWTRADPHAIIRDMRADDLDVLMLPDVGMTPVSRFLSLHRIAARQFTAWGHPVTTGSPEMDFYLSSDLMEPPDADQHYSERLVRLPNLALYLEEAENDPPPQPERFGLPEGRVLYGCLQSLFKYLPRHDALLPMIAREVPDALFVFLEGQPAYTTAIMQERLARAFAAEGLDAARHVTFLPRKSPTDYDRLMQAMDVLVDSVGWSGGNTSLRAIGLGVPLATQEGAFMRGRHTSAMFRMIGAEEMIADSAEAYAGLLARLGKDLAFRRHAAGLFSAGRPRLWRDSSMIAAFDAFLKSA